MQATTLATVRATRATGLTPEDGDDRPDKTANKLYFRRSTYVVCTVCKLRPCRNVPGHRLLLKCIEPSNAVSPWPRAQIFCPNHLSPAATSPLTIFRSSYSFVNSLLRISRSLTRPLQQFTKASLGVISPSV